MDEENDERICKNCKYYVEHYVAIGTQYQAIGGHCINSELNASKRKNRYSLHDNCDRWESDESRKAKTRKSIKEVLRAIELHLFYIKNILQNDE